MEPTSPIVDSQQQSFLSRYKFTIVSLVILLLAAIPLILLSKQHKEVAPAHIVKLATPTPTQVPLTKQSVDTTLNSNDVILQATLNQVTVDLNSVSQIDTSQDATTGL